MIFSRKISFFLTILLTVMSGTLGASSACARQKSGIDSLVALALKGNPEIKMARYESMAAQSRIGPASRLPDPQLKVAAMNIPTSFSLTSDMMTMVPQVSLMQTLPWFGKLGAAGDVQQYSYDASAEKLSAVALSVVADLKKVYGQIYSTEKSIAYLEYKKQLLQSVVKVAEQLFAVGQVPQQDVFRATAELTMVESDIITTQGMLSDLEANLGAILGQNSPYTIQVDSLQLPLLDSLAFLETRLAGSNPELKEIHNIELAAQAKRVFAAKDAVPDLSVGVSYGYRGALMANGAKASDVMSLEIGLSLPVFFGSKQQSMIDEADFMDRAAKEQYSAAELGLYSRLRSTFAEAYAQEKLIPLYSRELIPQYEATYNASLSSYSVGRTTFAMLIDNLTMLINTKIELVKIESKYFSTAAEISKLVGENSENHKGVR